MNAYLIAAAPELLEACDLLLADDAVSCYCDTLKPTEEGNCSLCIARKAVAKAKGKRP